MLTAAQQKFIDTIGPMAKAAQDKTKVPASVTIAQAILETGWGHHTIADANNLFGIKGVGPAGSVTVSTREVYNGSECYVDAPFRKYHNLAESVEDHANFFVVNRRYAHALAVASDANAFAREIQRAGYATDPNYAAMLIKLMQAYNLYQYDTAPPRPDTLVYNAEPPVDTADELNKQEAEHLAQVMAQDPPPSLLDSVLTALKGLF